MSGKITGDQKNKRTKKTPSRAKIKRQPGPLPKHTGKKTPPARAGIEKIQKLIELSGLMLLEMDAIGNAVYINKEGCKILGYPSKEINGKNFFNHFLPEKWREETRSAFRRLMAGGPEGEEMESPILTKAGEERLIRWHNAVITDEKGTIAGTISSGEDITDQKRSEDKLRLFSEAVEEAPDGVQIADLSGIIIYSNKAIEKIYGFSPQEYYGRHVDEMNADPEFAEKFILPQIRETGQWTGELMVKHKDGRIFPIWLTTSLIKNQVGEPIAMMGIIRDVTGHRKAEAEIINLTRSLLHRASELESAYKDMESFSYVASHDLKAPVTRIAGFTDILLEDYADKLDDYGKDCLNRISDNAGKMRLLIEDLLKFSSISAKEIQKSSINMESLTRSAYDEIKPTGRDIKLQIAAMPCADGDLSLLRQVILNLLTNATKFTRIRETGIIEVGGRTEKDENIYYVRDNGIGFDMKFVDKLFGLFQKIHISDQFEGTGIGLVIVKRIIEKHGGRVWAEGKLNVGATFYFTLPV